MPLNKDLLQAAAVQPLQYIGESGCDIDAPQIAESAALATERDQLAQCIRTEVARHLFAGSNDIYEQVIQQVEATMIDLVMQDSKQNLTRAAQRLGLSRPTLRSKLRARMPYQ